MLPFCGYNMADYFGHWLSIEGMTDADKLPKMFYVNWFRKGPDGRWLWPGFGENSRVLEWVFRRCAGTGAAVQTPIGLLPGSGAIPVEDLEVTPADMAELLRVDVDDWRAELPLIEEHFAIFGDRLPPALLEELDGLRRRLD
jgi:phosphoenolpyruvate carboxykinase (GTP)